MALRERIGRNLPKRNSAGEFAAARITGKIRSESSFPKNYLYLWYLQYLTSPTPQPIRASGFHTGCSKKALPAPFGVCKIRKTDKTDTCAKTRISGSLFRDVRLPVSARVRRSGQRRRDRVPNLPPAATRPVRRRPCPAIWFAPKVHHLLDE